MKNIHKKIAMLLLGCWLIVGSCTKELDQTNPNSVTAENFWATATDAERGVNSIYAIYYKKGGYARWIYFLYDLRSDEGTSTSPWLELQNWQKFVMINYNFEVSWTTWQDHYRGISRCNQVLEEVPDIVMDEPLKQRYLAEAKFMRALWYYNLTTLYGNVPLTLKVENAESRPATAQQSEVWAQIEKDLRDAANVLPETYGNADLGRPTKGAANAMLGKALMQQRKWSEAAAALAWLTEGAGRSNYQLVADFSDNFKHTTEFNSESVFEINFHDANIGPFPDEEDGPAQNMGNTRPQFFGPGGGLPGFGDGEMRRWVPREFLEEQTVDGQRDPRLAATCLYDSTDERGGDFTVAYGRVWNEVFAADNPRRNQMYYHKYQNDYYRDFENFFSPINHRLIRYADVLLMYAECLNQMGRTADAYQYVDLVRQRANLPTLTTAKPGMSQAQFQEQIEHERVTELAGESWRWSDLARWGYFDDLNKVAELRPRDPDFNSFDNLKYKFLPIPKDEVDRNPNVRQNPGY